MLKVRHDGWNGSISDHHRPRKRRMPAKQWRSLTAREYDAAPKVDVQGVACGIRRTFDAHRPFRLIRPAGDTFQLLDVYPQGDGTLQVCPSMSKEVLAVLVETDDGLSPVCPAPCCPDDAPLTPYEQAAARHREIEALLAQPLPPAQRAEVLGERKTVQRQMSRASFEELYLVGLKAFRDGNTDKGLVNKVLKVIALERECLRDGLTAREKHHLEATLLPAQRRAVATYVKYRRRIGQEL